MKKCANSAKKIVKIADELPDWQAETSIEAGLKDAKGRTVWAMKNCCSFRVPLLILLIGITAVCAILMATHLCRRRKKSEPRAIYCDCVAG